MHGTHFFSDKPIQTNKTLREIVLKACFWKSKNH